MFALVTLRFFLIAISARDKGSVSFSRKVGQESTKSKSGHSMRMKHESFTQNYRLTENQFDLEISEEIMKTANKNKISLLTMHIDTHNIYPDISS